MTLSVLSETQERFFKAIGKQLPLDRIIELHLFGPMRQGGVESGVAVIAAIPEGELLEQPEAASSPSTAPAPDGAAPVHASGAAQGAEAVVRRDDVTQLSAAEGPPAESVEEVIAEPVPDVVADVPPEALAEAVAGVEGVETPEAVAMAQASTELGDPAMEVAAELAELASEADAETPATDDIEGGEEMPAASLRPRRYTVYSARYRHVLKGPDRGKWEVTVVAEADAPLLTVDVVVRGVLRRSGDAAEAGRITGEELRRALRLPAAAPA